MKKLVRRIAIVVGATAMSIGLLGAVAAPSEAATHPVKLDSSWGY